MKRTITKIEITEEDDQPESSTSTSADGLLTLALVVIILVAGIQYFSGRRSQITIDQRGNSGTIINEWEVPLE